MRITVNTNINFSVKYLLELTEEDISALKNGTTLVSGNNVDAVKIGVFKEEMEE